MPAPAFDLAVVGLGGMGSSVAYHAASRGLRVIGLERFDLMHTRGSSHGVTRILRLGLHEGGHLVEMAHLARDLWLRLGEEAGERVFVECGSLDLGGAESAIVQRSLEACHAHGIDHELLDAARLAERVPGLRPDPDMVGVLQPGSGLVACERATEAHQRLAAERGAELHARCRVTGWEPEGDGWRVHTDSGSHLAERVVICPGAFGAGLVPELAGLVRAERQVIGWFTPAGDPGLFTPERMPCWIIDGPLGHFYGLPVHGAPGFKIARLTRDEPVDPEQPAAPPAPAEEADLRAVLARWFPAANGPVADLATCLFESSPDLAFIIDALPGPPGAFVAAGFSGHGFKYASLIGGVMVDLALGEEPAVDLAPFRLGRFAAATA